MNPDEELANSVEKHRESMEAWAKSDLPLADEMAVILKEVDCDNDRGIVWGE